MPNALRMYFHNVIFTIETASDPWKDDTGRVVSFGCCPGVHNALYYSTAMYVVASLVKYFLQSECPTARAIE